MTTHVTRMLCQGLHFPVHASPTRQLHSEETLHIRRNSSTTLYPFISLTMFRTALVRSARCLAQAAPRVQAPVASRVIPSSFAASRTAAPSLSVSAFRFYSAPSGLSQDEVQGRILDLLKNFDKVRSHPDLLGRGHC